MFHKSEDIFDEEPRTKEKPDKEEKKRLRQEEKQRRLNEKEDAKNAKKAAKAQKTIEMVENKNEKEKMKPSSVLLLSVVILLLLASGFAAAFLACYFNATVFHVVEMWPFILAVDVFFFTTVAFFSTEGKTEAVYGGFSLLSVACIVLQLVLIFG